MTARRATDAEYLRLYEREVRRYVARFTAGADSRACLSPGAAYLRAGELAWVDDGGRALERWSSYASGYGSLKAMQPDGSWRPWDWRGPR